MNDEETSSKDKNEDKKQELATLPAETSIEDSTKEKKVVVVKPGESDVKISNTSDFSEEVKREDDNIGQ